MRVLNLDELRVRYASASGGEIFDPEFQHVADLVFKDGDRRQAPYCGVPTLLKAPYRPDAISANDIDVALCGVGTFDGERGACRVLRHDPFEDCPMRSHPPLGAP